MYIMDQFGTMISTSYRYGYSFNLISMMMMMMMMMIMMKIMIMMMIPKEHSDPRSPSIVWGDNSILLKKHVRESWEVSPYKINVRVCPILASVLIIIRQWIYVYELPCKESFLRSEAYQQSLGTERLGLAYNRYLSCMPTNRWMRCQNSASLSLVDEILLHNDGNAMTRW